MPGHRLAERTGFEPAEAVNLARFPSVCLKPLDHLSKCGANLVCSNIIPKLAIIVNTITASFQTFSAILAHIFAKKGIRKKSYPFCFVCYFVMFFCAVAVLSSATRTTRHKSLVATAVHILSKRGSDGGKCCRVAAATYCDGVSFALGKCAQTDDYRLIRLCW